MEGDPPAVIIGQATIASNTASVEDMDLIDREILTLRHFEHLGIAECAITLGISKSVAGNRHLRSTKRLNAALDPPTKGAAGSQTQWPAAIESKHDVNR